MIIRADARSLPLRDGCVQCVVTSPPYWGLRDYGSPDQIGLEATPDAYVASLVQVFGEVRRVLADDGTVWLNLGDSYASDSKGSGGPSVKQLSNAGSRYAVIRFEHGMKSKDLMGIPWRVAFALQADGWYLRSDIIWAKPNPMPESVTDRPTKAHEYLFLLSKSERYFYDAQAIAERSLGIDAPTWDERKALGEGNRRGFAQNAPPGCHRVGGGETRNKRSVWTIPARAATDRADAMRDALERLAIDANRLCDRQLGGTYEADCRQSIEAARHALVEEDTRHPTNKRSVWTIPTMPYAGAHFATMPEKLVEPCILAGSRPGDLVLDPFCGSGTVLAVATRLSRRAVGTDLSYQDLAAARTAQRGLRFDERDTERSESASSVYAVREEIG